MLVNIMTGSPKNYSVHGPGDIHNPFFNFIRAQAVNSLFLLMATIVALWRAIQNMHVAKTLIIIASILSALLGVLYIFLISIKKV